MSNTLKMIVKHKTIPSTTRLGGISDSTLACYLCNHRFIAGQRAQFARTYIANSFIRTIELVSHVECFTKQIHKGK